MISQLEQELDFSYGLIRSFTQVNFPRPHIQNLSIQDFHKFCTAKNRKSALQDTPTMFFDSTSYTVFNINDELIDSAQRRFGLTHEVVHSMQDTINPALRMENIETLLKKKSLNQMAICYFAFCEGSANDIAIRAILESKDNQLADAAMNIADSLNKDYAEFASTSQVIELYRERFVQKFGKKPTENQLMAFFHDRNSGITLYSYRYIFGYNFTSQHQEKDPVAMIRYPPSYFSHIAVPEFYTKHYNYEIKKEKKK